jgi:hypothetical protein
MGLDLRVFNAGREIAANHLSPTEACSLAANTLDDVRDHLAATASESPALSGATSTTGGR